MPVRAAAVAGLLAGLAAVSAPLGAQQHRGHHGAGHGMAGGPAADTRERVQMPPMMAAHMLANMRDHLAALQEISEALSRDAFEEASRTAETRLGMSSLQAHGASHMAGFMPQGMRTLGTEMHKAASRLAVAAQNADVTGDLKPVLGALSEVTAACVACHAGYRVQ